MQIDLTTQLLDDDDKPATQGGEPLTLGLALIEAHKFTHPTIDDGAAKHKRRKMRLRIKAAVESADKGRAFELTSEELTEIKTLVGRWGVTDIVGQIWDIFESLQQPAAATTPPPAEPGGTE